MAQGTDPEVIQMKALQQWDLPPPAGCDMDSIDLLAPQILESINRNGHGATISALLSFAMSVAIDWGHPLAISHVFRHDARILEDYQPPRSLRQ